MMFSAQKLCWDGNDWNIDKEEEIDEVKEVRQVAAEQKSVIWKSNMVLSRVSI